MKSKPWNSKAPNGELSSAYAGKRVLVLGSTGFIGRWVARELCKAGAELFLPVRNTEKARSVFGAYGVRGKIIELDLLDEQGLASICDDVRPLITFNLAGYGVDRAEQNEELAFATNVALISRLCAAISGARRSSWSGLDIVHAGTAMEYGQIRGDLAENSIAKPTTLYGSSKLAGTRSLAEACERLGLKGVTARLFSVYGPGESPQRLLPTLMGAARSGDDIRLTQGQHKRDFVYVEDVARAMVRLGVSPALSDYPVNVATGLLTSVRTFVEVAAGILGIEQGRFQFGSLPTRAEEMEHRPVVIGRLRYLTGWAPRTTIAAGIRATRDFADSLHIQATGENVDLRGSVYARSPR